MDNSKNKKSKKKVSHSDLTRPYTSKELEMIREFEAKRNTNK